MRLAALASYIPERRIEAEEIIVSAGGRRAEARVFGKLFGIERVAAADPKEPIERHFAAALDRLPSGDDRAPADALIYVHGLPIQYATGNSPAAKLRQSHPMLGSVELVYEVDQNNCAGLFWALQMARELLLQDLARCVLILAGDSLADLPLAHRYVPGCTLIGDAFVALMVDRSAGGIQIGRLALSSRCEFAFGLYGTAAETREFYAAHDEMVTIAMDAVGYAWSGEELMLPHNVNRLTWIQFCRRRQIGLERVQLDLLPDIGHCYTTDPLLLLVRLLARSRPPGPVTLISTGLGAYTGACRLHFGGEGL